MRSFILSAAVAITVALAGCTSTTTTTAPDAKMPAAAASSASAATDAIAAAVADANRPAEDVARDAARKPSDMLAFAGVKPGDKVIDFIPGGGYFTRVFAKAVGAGGHVYAVSPPPQKPGAPSAVDKIAADAAYANVSVVPLVGALTAPEPVDIVWTAQNYHDLHLARLNVDVPAMNKAVFAALKPGGVFVVLDHAALPGTGLDVPDKLHRINPDIVKQEVTAAGFVFESESTVLRNDTDPHTMGVFDPAIRGKTDQFIFKFRKPN